MGVLSFKEEITGKNEFALVYCKYIRIFSAKWYTHVSIPEVINLYTNISV